MIVTTENCYGPGFNAEFVAAATAAGLRVVRHERWTEVTVATVTIPADTEQTQPHWRDLGSGPAWQERYEIRETLTVDVVWRSDTEQLTALFPVVSVYRQGGAKWGGVSVAVRDDETERDSTHWLHAYEFAGFATIGQSGTFAGFPAQLVDGVSVRETPYKHDPTITHWVLDLSA